MQDYNEGYHDSGSFAAEDDDDVYGDNDRLLGNVTSSSSAPKRSRSGMDYSVPDRHWQKANESDLVKQMQASLDKAFGQGNASLKRISPFRYRMTGGGRSETVTLDPIFQAPVIHSKILVPGQEYEGNTAHFDYTAQAFKHAKDFREALDVGLNVPRFSDMTQRHTGGQITFPYVSMLRSLRQISDEKLRTFYGLGERNPLYFFEENRDLLAMPSHFRGKDSADSDSFAGRGIMAAKGTEIFGDWVGYGIGNNGRFLVPSGSKSHSRAKLLGNLNPFRAYIPTDDRAQQAGDTSGGKVRRSALRGASGRVNEEVIADTLFASHIVAPPGQMFLSENLADRITLSRAKLHETDMTWEDTQDIRLTGMELGGDQEVGGRVNLYHRLSTGHVASINDPDAERVAVRGQRWMFPQVSNTAHVIGKYKSAENQPLETILRRMGSGEDNYFQRLINGPDQNPEAYEDARIYANQLLAENNHPAYIGEGRQVRGREMPVLQTEYASFSPIRTSHKVMGTAGLKGVASVNSRLANAADPAQQSIFDNADALIAGGEAVKGPQFFASGLANAVVHRNIQGLREDLGQRFGLYSKRNEDGDEYYPLEKDTWGGWKNAVDYYFGEGYKNQDGDRVGGLKAPSVREKLKDWGILHENVAVDQRMSVSSAAPFMSGLVPGYETTDTGDEYGTQNVRTPQADILDLPIPMTMTMTVPESGRPGRNNFGDLQRVWRSHPEMFDTIYGQGEAARKVSRSILNAALGTPPDKDTLMLDNSVVIGEAARQLQMKETGIDVDKASDQYFVRAMQEEYGDRDIAFSRNGVNVRLFSANAAARLGNFNTEGVNNTRATAEWIRMLREGGSMDTQRLSMVANRLRATTRNEAITRSARKGLFQGELDNSNTHVLLGDLAMPDNMVGSGYVPRRREDEEGNMPPETLVKADRWPAVNDVAQAPVIGRNSAEILKGIGSLISTNPRFLPKNSAIMPVAPWAQIRQADVDGDTGLLTRLTQNARIIPRSIEGIRRDALVASALSPERVEELMAGSPVNAWSTMAQTRFGRMKDGEAANESKMMDWMGNYHKGGRGMRIEDIAGKLTGGMSEVDNTTFVQGALNEAWAKITTGAVDTGVEALLNTMMGRGISNRESYEHISPALGMNLKQPTIDAGGSMNLTELENTFTFAKSGYWPDIFDSRHGRGEHADAMVGWLNRAKRAGINLQALEPALRDTSVGDPNQRNDALYNFLREANDSGDPVTARGLYSTLLGVDPSSDISPEQMYAAGENTSLSIYGRSQSFYRTHMLMSNNDPVKLDEIDTKGNQRYKMAVDSLRIRGEETIPGWHNTLLRRSADNASIRTAGIGIDTEDARERAENFVRRMIREDPAGAKAFYGNYANRVAMNNATVNEIESGPEGYSEVLAGATERKDLMGQILRKNMRSVTDPPEKTWAKNEPISIPRDDFYARLQRRATEVRDTFRAGGYDAVESAFGINAVMDWNKGATVPGQPEPLRSTEVFSPSQLKGRDKLQDIIEGHVMNWRERSYGQNEEDAQRTGVGTIYHKLYEDIRREDLRAIGIDPDKEDDRRIERRVLYTGAGMVIQGQADEFDPAQRMVTDYKFINASRFDRIQAGGQNTGLGELEGQVASYVLGAEEMLQQDGWRGRMMFFDSDAINEQVTDRLGAVGFTRNEGEGMKDFLSRAVESGPLDTSMMREAIGQVRQMSHPVEKTENTMRTLFSLTETAKEGAWLGAQTAESYYKPLVNVREGEWANREPTDRDRENAVRKGLAIMDVMQANDLEVKPRWYNNGRVYANRKKGLLGSMVEETKKAESEQLAQRAQENSQAKRQEEFLAANVQKDAGGAAAQANAPNPATPHPEHVQGGDKAGNVARKTRGQYVYERFEDIAKQSGLKVRRTEPGQIDEAMRESGYAGTYDPQQKAIFLDKERAPMATDKGNAIAFEELGHAMDSMATPGDNIPNIAARIGMNGGFEGFVQGQLGNYQAAYYSGNMEAMPDDADTPREMAAFAFGSYLRDPAGFEAQVGPEIAGAVHRTLSQVSPGSLVAAGVKPADTSHPQTKGIAAAQRPDGGSGISTSPDGRSMSASLQSSMTITDVIGAVTGKMGEDGTIGLKGKVDNRTGKVDVSFMKPKKINVGEEEAIQKRIDGTTEALNEFGAAFEEHTKILQDGTKSVKDSTAAQSNLYRWIESISKIAEKPWEYDWSSQDGGGKGNPAHNLLRDNMQEQQNRISGFQAEASRIGDRMRAVDTAEHLKRAAGITVPGEEEGGPFAKKGGGGGGGGGGSRRRGGGGGGEGGGPPGMWGGFTDEMGGFAGLGWAGFASFSLQRINSLMFGGIKQDVETYRRSASGMSALNRTLYGPSDERGLTERMVGNAFVQNYVKTQSGETFSGIATMGQDMWNQSFTIGQQESIHTAKELTKGVLGAGAAGVVAAYMGRKGLGGIGKLAGLGKAGAIIGGYSAMQESGDDAVGGLINAGLTAASITWSAGELSKSLGGTGQGSPQNPNPAVYNQSDTRASIPAPIFGSYSLGSKVSRAGRAISTGPVGRNFRALGGIGGIVAGVGSVVGAVAGITAIGEAASAGVDDKNIDWNEYQRWEQGGSFLTRPLSRWLADKDRAPLTRAAFGFLDRNALLATQPFDEHRQKVARGGAIDEDLAMEGKDARYEQMISREAFKKGDLSGLGIKTAEDLTRALGAADAGANPEDVARMLSDYMRSSKVSIDDLTSGPNPHVGLLHGTVTTAIRENMTATEMNQYQSAYSNMLGYSPSNPAAAQLQQNFQAMTGQQQQNALVGAQTFAQQWSTSRMPLSSKEDTEKLVDALGELADKYTENTVARGMELATPTNEYTFNESVARGVTDLKKLGETMGIRGLAPTLDLETGRRIGDDRLRELERGQYYAGLDQRNTEMSIGIAEREQSFGYQSMMHSKQREYRMADFAWSAMSATNQYQRSLESDTLQWAMTQQGFAYQEQQMGFQRTGFNMGVRHSEQDYALRSSQMERGLAMQLAERGMQRQIMMTQYAQQDEELAIEGERRPVNWQWRFEDLNYAGERAGLEHGWQQEDYRRNMRFATGREKVGMRREMERDQVRYGMEEGQRDKQQDRLEQQKEWEDEDFERKKKNYEELKELQIGLFDMQTAHALENAAMQRESLDLQRRQQLEQQTLQSVQMTAAEENYAVMKELQTEMHDLQLEHMKEAYDEQMANIARQREEYLDMWLKQKIQMEIENKQAVDRDTRLQAYWKKIDEIEEERYNITIAQEDAINAMNLVFMKWHNEVFPASVEVANIILDMYREIKGGGGTPPPPGGEGEEPVTEIEALRDAIRDRVKNGGALSPSSWPTLPEAPNGGSGSSDASHSALSRSTGELAEELANRILNTNVAGRWLNNVHSRNGRL